MEDSLASSTIAVVIPVYNGAQYIGEALRSIEAQTRRPERVVVVDDGSTDGTGSVIAGVAANSSLPLTVVNQRNRGIAAARNAGIDRCEEDLIAFLDGDDTFYPMFLERASNALSRHPELLLCFLDRDVVDADGTFLRRDLDHPLFRTIESKRCPDGVSVLTQNPFLPLLAGNVIPIGMMVRRSVILDIGGFDEEMRFVEDRLFLMKLAKRGKFGFLDEPLGIWRRHSSNASGAGNAYGMALYGDLALEKIERDSRALHLTADELRAIRDQRKRNAGSLLFTASNEAHRDFFRLAWRLVRDGRAPWMTTAKACLRYGRRRLALGR